MCPSPLQAWPAAGVFVSCLTRNGIRPSDQSFQELTSPGWRRSPRFPVVASSDEQLFSSRHKHKPPCKSSFSLFTVWERRVPSLSHGPQNKIRSLPDLSSRAIFLALAPLRLPPLAFPLHRLSAGRRIINRFADARLDLSYGRNSRFDRQRLSNPPRDSKEF